MWKAYFILACFVSTIGCHLARQSFVARNHVLFGVGFIMLTEENGTNQLARVRLFGLYGGDLMRVIVITNVIAATNQSSVFK